jgi:hypothetical protein
VYDNQLAQPAMGKKNQQYVSMESEGGVEMSRISPDVAGKLSVLDAQTTSVSVDAALNMIGFGKFQYRLYALCGFCFMADAMEVMLLTFLQRELAREWSLSTVEEASLTSAVFGGEMVGAIFWGVFADRRGRRAGYLWSLVAMSIFGVASAACPDLPTLLVCRACVGFGVAGVIVPFDLLAELLPEERRGRLTMAIEFFWTIGTVAVALFAALLLPLHQQHGWRLLVGACCLPMVACLAMYPSVPESPRWLVESGDPVKREEALRWLHLAAEQNGVSLPPNLRLRGPTAAEAHCSGGGGGGGGGGNSSSKGDGKGGGSVSKPHTRSSSSNPPFPAPVPAPRSATVCSFLRRSAAAARRASAVALQSVGELFSTPYLFRTTLTLW